MLRVHSLARRLGKPELIVPDCLDDRRITGKSLENPMSIHVQCKDVVVITFDTLPCD